MAGDGRIDAPEPPPLLEAALHLRELFVSLVSAGFTEDQAIRLCAYATRSTPDDPEAPR